MGEPPRAIVHLDGDGHRGPHAHELVLGGQPAAVLVTEEMVLHDHLCPALRYRVTLSADGTLDFCQGAVLDERGSGKSINPSVRGDREVLLLKTAALAEGRAGLDDGVG